jgi:lipopolysaccharide/colanic/teichoic acid biosynthesis glycosyltransferase
MLKRAFDIVSSAIFILAISPLLLPIMLFLRVTGEGKVFFVQKRVGKGGRTFGLLKFATMLENSPNMPGGDVTSGNDPRVLPAGRFLRKTKINELPQLFNIFLGSMSVVGPRPMTPRNFGYYSPEIQAEIRDLKPGLTGIGSIVFRDEERILSESSKAPMECFVEDIAPYKGALEVWYKQHQGFGMDLLLIFLTIWAVLFPRSELHFRLLKDLPRSTLFGGR